MRDNFDARKYERNLSDAGAEDYEKGVREYVIEHKCFVSSKWGRKFSGLFLDYGCGTGLVTRHIISAGRGVVGTDISKNMCSVTKRLWGVSVIVADGLNLPFRNRVFSVVCVSGVLHHLPQELETAFTEMTRCTDKAICIIEPSTTPPAIPLRLIRFFDKVYVWLLRKSVYKLASGKYTYSKYERPLNPGKLKKMCEKHGFKILELRFFNHIPRRFTWLLSERILKHLVNSMISPLRGTDVEIVAMKNDD